MEDLIAMLEKATAPDRELDCLIYAEIDNRDVRWDGHKLLARSRVLPHDTCWLGTIDPGRVQRNFTAMGGFEPPIPYFTKSLDAAMTLVPDGWSRSVGRDESGKHFAYAWKGTDLWSGHEGAPNDAIALCIAALKARAALTAA